MALIVALESGQALSADRHRPAHRAHRLLRLSDRRGRPRIPDLDCELVQASQIRQRQLQRRAFDEKLQSSEVVRSGDEPATVSDDGFEVFLDRLLGVETGYFRLVFPFERILKRA